MHLKKYKSILSSQNGFNLYRGCTHGCIYCDSRSKCYQINHPFEDIEIKESAPAVLENEIAKRRKPVMISTGSMTDPYLHAEATYLYTRACLEVVFKYGFGICILSKSDMILRDIDLIKKINDQSKAVVQMTLTTADDQLCKIIEPNVAPTSRRFAVLQKCKELRIPTVVWLCPFLPFINDTEENINSLMDMCIEAEVKGIVFFGVGLTLREGNREYFYKFLDKNFPGLKEKYMHLYENRYTISSPNHKKLSEIILRRSKENNIPCTPEEVFAYLREFPQKIEQLSLF